MDRKEARWDKVVTGVLRRGLSRHWSEAMAERTPSARQCEAAQALSVPWSPFDRSEDALMIALRQYMLPPLGARPHSRHPSMAHPK